MEMELVRSTKKREQTIQDRERQSLELLQQMSWNWINAETTRTKTELAREVGVSEATVRRLLNDGKIPNTENVMRFVSFFGNANRLNDEINEKNGMLADLIAENLPFSNWSTHKDYQILRKDQESKLDTNTKILLFEKAELSCGFPQEEVRFEFGIRGIEEANKLVEQGILILDNGTYRANGIQNYSYSYSMLVKAMAANLETYLRPESVNAVSSLVTDLVNQEGYNLLKEELTAMTAKVRKIIAENPGQISFYSMHILDYKDLSSKLTKDGKEQTHEQK